jgi:predicted O-methyltransferase YrrM
MSRILYPEQYEYLNKTIAKKDQFIVELEKFAHDNRIPILDQQSAEFLDLLLQISKPKSFLEIGTAIGYSTIRVSKMLSNDAKIHTIELSKNNIRIAKSNFEKAGLCERINIFEGNAIEIMQKLDSKYDFIFLDADKEDYSKLFKLAIKLLDVGSVILVDNLLWKGYTVSKTVPDEYKKSTELIRKFNAEFLGSPFLKSSILPIGDGLGIGIKLK